MVAVKGEKVECEPGFVVVLTGDLLHAEKVVEFDGFLGIFDAEHGVVEFVLGGVGCVSGRHCAGKGECNLSVVVGVWKG